MNIFKTKPSIPDNEIAYRVTGICFVFGQYYPFTDEFLLPEAAIAWIKTLRKDEKQYKVKYSNLRVTVVEYTIA